MTYKEYTALLQISEQEAHRRLFDEYYRYVRTIVFNRLRSFSDEDVEECISDIFAEAFFIYYNMDSKQIAGELAMKPSAVRMRCKRAAAKLKEVLASKGFGEGTL